MDNSALRYSARGYEAAAAVFDEVLTPEELLEPDELLFEELLEPESDELEPELDDSLDEPFEEEPFEEFSPPEELVDAESFEEERLSVR